MDNQFFELTSLSVVSAVGARASEFLQGQVTADLRLVTEESMRQAALCNLKGRVLALMDVLKWQNYSLVLPANLIPATIQSLSKAALLSRVQLQEETNYYIFGIYRPDASSPTLLDLPYPETLYSVTSNNSCCLYNIGDNYYLLLLADAALAETLRSQSNLLDDAAWHEKQLKRLRVSIYPETQGLFLTHRLNLHNTGYISFDKGCYKGQEIIARTHYRATIKHSLQGFVVDKPQNLQLGMKFLDPSSQAEVAELVDFCLLPGGRCWLVLSILHEHPTVVLLGEEEVNLGK